MKINDITEAVGNTPLLRLNRFCKAMGIAPTVYAKLEMFNPYSVKDRAALSMLDGIQKTGGASSIIEATSGNTGIGLCMVCAVRGIPITIVMPENATEERKKIMSLLGAKLVLTPASEGMSGANRVASELLKTTDGAVMSSQFSNPDNPKAHYQTAKELLDDMDGNIDYFVSAVGTGGTFSGVASVLKTKNGNLKAIAVEPSRSNVLSGGTSGPHNIPGIGAGFVPENFDRALCDRVIAVSDDDALNTCKILAKTEGVLAGISSGAALWACVQVAREFPNKNVVTIFPDSLERYFSMV